MNRRLRCALASALTVGLVLPVLTSTARAATTTDAPFCMLKGNKLLQINKQSYGRLSNKALRALEQRYKCEKQVDVIVRRADAIAAFPCKQVGCEPLTGGADAGTSK